MAVTSAPRRERSPARALLTHPRLPLFAAALALLLTLPALGGGWRMDDYYHRAAFLHPRALRGLTGALPNGTAAGLFHFIDGEPRHVRAAIELGLFPWWTDPKLRAIFFRPVTGLTHCLDYWLWPDSALLMHAHSLAWFGALVITAALFYRRFLGRSTTAGLAALLFAVDSGHGMAVGWLANRNLLVAAFFGVLSVLAYDRGRREGWPGGRWAAPLLLALSLLSAEAGIATFGYLLAYAAFLDPAPRRARARALLPSLAVVAGWRLLETGMGVGVRGMGLYADPGAGLARSAAAVMARAPVFLFGQWWLLPAEISYVLKTPAYRVLWGAALVELIVLASCLWPLLPDVRARFFAAGMLLSVIPICAAFPDNRLLMFVSLGANGLLAQFLSGAVGPSSSPAKSFRLPSLTRPVALALAALHLGAAPLLLPLQARGFPGIYAPLYAAVPLDPALRQQSVLLVNGPLAFLAADLPLVQALEGRPVPRHTRVLFPSLAAMRIERPDARTLLLTPRGGYLARPVDTLFRDPRDRFSPGERVELSDVTIQVTELTPDGRPAAIACHFPVPLEDRSLRWLCWRGGRYRPFRPPPVGGMLQLPPALPGEWMGGRRGGTEESGVNPLPAQDPASLAAGAAQT